MTIIIKQTAKENLYLRMETDKNGLYIITLSEYGKTLYRYMTASRKNALAAYNRKRKEVKK